MGFDSLQGFKNCFFFFHSVQHGLRPLQTLAIACSFWSMQSKLHQIAPLIAPCAENGDAIFNACINSCMDQTYLLFFALRTMIFSIQVQLVTSLKPFANFGYVVFQICLQTSHDLMVGYLVAVVSCSPRICGKRSNYSQLKIKVNFKLLFFFVLKDLFMFVCFW